MLQDLALGRLENEYRQVQPGDGDAVICIQDGGILLKRNQDDTLEFPSVTQVGQWWDNRDSLQYVFRLRGKNHFLWLGRAGECPDGDYSYEKARTLRQLISKDICYAAMTGWHLYNWYTANRFCGRCGKKTVHAENERMLRCPNCGNSIYPRINPAVIVAVTDGDRIVFTKYAGRSYTRYALIAGFTEIGETLEQTVQREVMEEVGLRVRNIRYYKSQPWGIDGNILMGFYCDLDGDDAITLDEQELSVAEWHHRNALPAQDDGISLTREMMRIFGEGKEPK